MLSAPCLLRAEGGGAKVIKGNECTIDLAEVGGDDVTTTHALTVETPRGALWMVCHAVLPDGMAPLPRVVRTSGDICETPLGPTTDTKKVIITASTVRQTCRVSGKPLPTSGWAIGIDKDGNAAIVHTTDGGQTWQVQVDSLAWAGCSGKDISAVDDRTAWAVLGCGELTSPWGAILHTTDGGATWVSQAIPAGVSDWIKGVKGLSRKEAWAVSLGGTILYTTDGGATWNIVPHRRCPSTKSTGWTPWARTSGSPTLTSRTTPTL